MSRRGPWILALALALAMSACTSQGTPAPTSPSSAKTVTSSALVLGGRVRCTASVETPVRAGEHLGLRFTLENLTDRSLQAGAGSGSTSFRLLNAGGLSYDTDLASLGLGGGYVAPMTLGPGASKTLDGGGPLIRWSGPLSITPRCEHTSLPGLRVDVTAATPVPSEDEALAQVVAASGHLLDDCRPVRPGVPVWGVIAPPSGNAPSMSASCSIGLEHQGSFLVGHVLVVTPPELLGVRVTEPYERVTLSQHRGTAEGIAWAFVVTGDGAVPVASSTADTTRRADAMAPDWDWTGTSWEGPGGSRCGGDFTAGGIGADATIEFVSVCPP